ncbi:hypothetical protein SLS55_005019 [Diplodia seriata]|uniref:Uncharacterized protein n=1 Tax=Diplodia seriata TaxID=420778 RepID=A0ABR3CF61_9PEZI
MEQNDEPDISEDLGLTFETELLESGPYRKVQFVTPAVQESILRRAQTHQEYRWKIDVFRNLPRFDDLTVYGESDTAEEDRIWAEIQRLSEHFQHHDGKSTLLEAQSPFGSLLSQQTVQDIATVAEVIMNSLEICIYDASLVLIRNMSNHRKSRMMIKRMVENAVLRAHAASRTLIREYVGSEVMEARPPRSLLSGEPIEPVYMALLDYCTALLSKYLLSTVKGDAWTHRCLAVLSRMTAKLKLIGKDPATFAQQSIQCGRDLLSELEYRSEDPNGKDSSKVEAILVDKWYGYSDKPEPAPIDIIDDISPTMTYYLDLYKMRVHLVGLIRRMLDPLSSVRKVTDAEPFSFEINTIIHAATEDSPLLLISNDRHSNLSISSETIQLRFCHTACDILLANVEELKARDSPQLLRSDDETLGSHTSTIDWTFTDFEEGDETHPSDSDASSLTHARPTHLRVNKPEDYISVLLSLVLTSSAVSSQTTSLVSLVQRCLGTEKRIKVYSSNRFSGIFTFKSSFSDEESPQLEEDVMALSKFRDIACHSVGMYVSEGAILSKKAHPWRRYLSGIIPRSPSNSSPSDDGESGFSAGTGNDQNCGVHPADRAYAEHRHVLNNWRIDEKSVTVPCNGFVLSALAFFGTVVALGLVLLFTCKGTLEGVDISNILIFLWTFAVFGIGLSKSWYTKDWPWHDFIRRQLVCRSVGELHRVSGIDEQVILTHLLRYDHQHFYTKGPYNSVFIRRQSKTSHLQHQLESIDGFTVDRPLKLSTLLACGFLVLKVGKPDGNYLVCIGGRKKTESIGLGTTTKRLVCLAPSVNNPGKKVRKDELIFKEEQFVWDLSYGLYTSEEASFG